MTYKYVKVKFAEITYREEIISFDLNPDGEFYHLNKALDGCDVMTDKVFDEIMREIGDNVFYKTDEYSSINQEIFSYPQEMLPEKLIYDAEILTKEDYDKLSAQSKLDYAFNKPINKIY